MTVYVYFCILHACLVCARAQRISDHLKQMAVSQHVGRWESNMSPLQKCQVFLTAVPPLQPHDNNILYDSVRDQIDKDLQSTQQVPVENYTLSVLFSLFSKHL